ncbi:hypothetical protein CRE_18498 [Caenorhabditis remanei]|uniref:Uncharacterized protein n=1 Tax=Caenorhabditis remanei TaxID=31234 RepID=E3LKV9_CAERE|nr:hypothetical protein CRE_18501 [Caenorhabditis remanei]EFP00037.1 hypothetical protein CRE_18498 [Caenorhabditis remanei]
MEKLRTGEQGFTRELNDSRSHKETVHKVLKDYTVDLSTILNNNSICIHHSKKKKVNLDNLEKQMEILKDLRNSGMKIINQHSVIERQLVQ